MGRSTEDRLKEVRELYKNGLFDECIRASPDANELTLDEQIARFRREGINYQTAWFRDWIALAILKDMIIPNHESEEPLKVASVGCSTGVEPYSIILDNWDQRNRLAISGFDVDPSLVSYAQEGVYWFDLSFKDYAEIAERVAIPGNAVTVVSEGIERAELKYDGLEYDIEFAELGFTPEAKKHVSFAVHDILEEPLEEKHDVIFMLNVLMHYSKKGRAQILKNVYDSLSDGGWLVCEKSYLGENGTPRQRYFDWMRNIEHLGFEKQNAPLSGRGFLLDDMTYFTQLYQKRNEHTIMRPLRYLARVVGMVKKW